MSTESFFKGLVKRALARWRVFEQADLVFSGIVCLATSIKSFFVKGANRFLGSSSLKCLNNQIHYKKCIFDL